MIDWNSEDAGAFMVPEPLRQIGDYELDLLKLGYFGWLNSVSLGMNLWQAHCVPEDQDE